jgi:hypothetical protein
MNDPGVHEPIHEAAEDVDNNPYEHEEELEIEEEENFLDPRYFKS